MNLSEKVTVMIVTWNRDDLLKKCLDSMTCIWGNRLRVVVVDNANSEATAKLISAYNNVTCVPTKENLGFAGGNNIGYPFCEGEYVLLLNNDTIFRADSITPLVEFMDTHPRVALAQGRSVFADNEGLIDTCGMEVSPIGQLSYPGSHGPVGGGFDVTGPRPAAGGPFCLFRKAAIDSVGGELYHAFFWAYFEDVDLSFRVWRGGWEVWYVATPPVLHRHNMTSKMFANDYVLEHFYFNVWVSYITCFGLYGWVRFLPLFAFFYFCKGLLALIRGNVGYFALHSKVLRRLWWERRTVSDIRRRLSKCRVLDDRKLICALVRSQPFKYYRDAFGL